MIDSDKTISVKLNERWIERLDQLAKKGGVSRHHLMRNLIEVGMKGIHASSYVGLFQLGVAIRDLFNLRKKVEPGEEKPLPLRLDEKLLEKIDLYAKRGDLSRNQLIRNILQIGIEEIEGAQRVGLLQLSLWMRDVENAIKRIISNGEKAAQAVDKDFELTK